MGTDCRHRVQGAWNSNEMPVDVRLQLLETVEKDPCRNAEECVDCRIMTVILPKQGNFLAALAIFMNFAVFLSPLFGTLCRTFKLSL
jgi:hypothetical protein